MLFSTSFCFTTFGGSFLYMADLSQVVPLFNETKRASMSYLLQGATSFSTVTFLLFGSFIKLEIYDCFKILLGMAIVLPSFNTISIHRNQHKMSDTVQNYSSASSVEKNSSAKKLFRQLVYLSLYLYSTIVSIRLVLLFYKLDYYLSFENYPEKIRPLLAIFQMFQFIPSIVFGIIYDRLDKRTNFVISSIIMAFTGITLVNALNFTLQHNIVTSLILANILSSFCFGFLASFGNKFISKSKNSALLYGLLNTSYAIASLSIIQENIKNENILYFTSVGCFLFPLTLFLYNLFIDKPRDNILLEQSN